MEIQMDRYIELIKTLPPLVAAVVWDVVNGRITQSTVDLTQAASKEEFDRFDIIRCVAAANPGFCRVRPVHCVDNSTTGSPQDRQPSRRAQDSDRCTA